MPSGGLWRVTLRAGGGGRSSVCHWLKHGFSRTHSFYGHWQGHQLALNDDLRRMSQVPSTTGEVKGMCVCVFMSTLSKGCEGEEGAEDTPVVNDHFRSHNQRFAAEQSGLSELFITKFRCRGKSTGYIWFIHPQSW